MLISSSWCSVGTFLYSYILPLLPRNSNWMFEVAVFPEHGESLSCFICRWPWWCICCVSAFMTGFKMLVYGVEAGGKGEVPTFLWGQIVEDVAETLTVRDLTAVAVLPEGQRSSSDLSRWWSRPAGYEDCFQLLWSVRVSRSGSTNTIRAPEEIITAAGTVSAPELGAGEWWSSFMKVPIVPSVQATNAVLVQVYSVRGPPVIPLCPPDESERGFQRNVWRLTPLFGKESWEAFLGRWY